MDFYELPRKFVRQRREEIQICRLVVRTTKLDVNLSRNRETFVPIKHLIPGT